MSDKKAFVFDTNFIIQNPKLDEVIEKLKDDYTVYISQVSIDERIAQQCRELKQEFEEVEKCQNKYSHFAEITFKNSYETMTEIYHNVLQEKYNTCFGDKVILNDVSIKVKKGEFVTILGPSGCGKTTLLRLLAGFGEADSGQIRINGQDYTHVPPHLRPVNTVFQRYALFPHLNVYDNITLRMNSTHA